MVSKIFIGFVLINISFSNCKPSEGYKKTNNVELQEICQAFVKAICTKDTATFYRLVDKAALITSMNEWEQQLHEDRKITQDDLSFLFFFVYGPLIIRHQDLMDKRNKVIFFKYFKVKNIKIKTDNTVKVHLVWKENISNAKSAEIELTLQKNSEWKIVGARWKTL
jgi:hypothetical protein